MTKYIATKLHQALEFSPDPLLREMATVPHYVVDDSLNTVMQSDSVGQSITAMIAAGVCRLPYPRLLVEFSLGVGRAFVLLQESAGVLQARQAVLHGAVCAVAPAAATLSFTGDGVSVDGFMHKHEGVYAAFAAFCALMMLNTRGIAKELIEPNRLNAKRLVAGRIAVPRHTVVRVGTVYARDGKIAGSGKTGRSMPVHLRAGHVREQRYGENWEKTRPIYIEPVLVNYVGEMPARPPQKVLAK